MRFTFLALAFVTAFTQVLAVGKFRRSGDALQDGECEVSNDNPAPGVCNYHPNGDEAIVLTVPCDPNRPCINTDDICLFEDDATQNPSMDAGCD